MNLILLGLALCLVPSAVFGCTSSSTDAILSAWKKCNGTGYNSITTNVKYIKYSSNYVYINAASIPDYTIGPWSQNPNTPADKDFIYKYARSVVKSGKTKVSLGSIGQWVNGVAMYNADDGQTYNNAGFWTRNAYFWEGVSFDACFGHADASSTYHIHVYPKCLFTSLGGTSTKHSPILGWLFDGVPIYGPYGYDSANDTSSSIVRIKTSYKTRSIATRSSYANGTTLSGSQLGPTINSTYPLGAYLEDYEYSAGYGHLDEYNGRYGKTPEFPNGVYAYFATIDSSGNPEYPFTVGPYYYGTVETSNIMGPNAGKTSPSEAVTSYFVCSATTSAIQITLMIASVLFVLISNFY